MGDVLGVADVVFQNGNLYAVTAGGGCSHGNTAFPNALLEVSLRDGSWKTVANLSRALVEFPAKITSPDDFEPDGTWYGLISSNGSLITGGAEPWTAILGDHWRPGKSGNRCLSFAGSYCADFAGRRAGVLYVGNLNLFPINPQWRKVMTVAKGVLIQNPLPGFSGTLNSFFNWNIVSSMAGFTTIVSMKVGPEWIAVCAGAFGCCRKSDAGRGEGCEGYTLGDHSRRSNGACGADGYDVWAGWTAVCVESWSCSQGTPGQILRIEVPAVQ